jgi:hypothetical protein
MRYEMFFVSTSVAPDRAAFERYFGERDNYAVTRGAARYANEDTGVDFLFEYGAFDHASSGARPWARFALDYVRPSFFADEATRELELFTGRFGPAVFDAGGTAPAPFATHVFLRRWEAGNRAACGPFPGTGDASTRVTLPRRTLLATWQWNYRRKGLQEGERDGLFVPKVLFMGVDAGVATCVIWPDAMAIRAPQVDHVIFTRDTLAPRGLLGRRPDVAVAAWAEIAGLVTGDAYYDGPIVSWRVTDPRILTGLARRVASLPGSADMPVLVPPHEVLDREGFAGGLS